ncbi:MAG: thiosulfate oxidation carrier complex protein SoxZ [Proteobacteria bacterium]|nr:thiosulfate oxidation carrier complex protein SoxZ [Pseudomonadota bacterium]MCH9758334.1 thiosulfate oxidation carrier complex protein SoxZ [Pseudomonadota bacterium]
MASMRVKTKVKNGLVEVKLIAKHPMESGQAKDKDGNLIPAHFIEALTATVGDNIVFTANLGPAVSKDPYLKFYYQGSSGDVVKLHWADNQGAEDSTEAKVK